MAETRRQTVRSQFDLLALAEGFFPAQVLFALHRMGIFAAIGAAEQTVDELAARTGAAPDRLVRLLNAGVQVNLLESEDAATYRVPHAWQSLLATAGDRYLGDWVDFLSSVNTALSRLDEAVLRGGPVQELWNAQAADIRRSTLAMHNYAALRGKELVQFLDTGNCRTLLDVGCGPGTYAFLLGQYNPALALHLLDVPEVLAVAKEIETRYALANAVTYLPLDFMKDEIPGTYDLILLSNTLHVLDEAGARAFVKRLYDVVTPGGSLVIQTPFLNEDRQGGRWPIFVDLNLLCLTPNGRNHSAEETRRWLCEAGFSRVESTPMSIFNVNSLLRAFKEAAP